MKRRLVRTLLLVWGFLHVGCSCDHFPKCADLKLAPEISRVDELAFSVSYPDEPTPVLCREIEVSSLEHPYQTHWKARTSKPLPCPNPLAWGQDLGEGWEVLVAPLPLERNRPYKLSLTLDDGQGKSRSTSEEWLDFCAFQNGSLAVFHYYRCFSYAPEREELEREHMARCMQEGQPAPLPEEDSAERSAFASSTSEFFVMLTRRCPKFDKPAISPMV